MDDRFGTPPRSGWARLAPELLVEDIAASLRFWCDVLGFNVAYQRPDDLFAYLERPEGAQIMLCQRYGEWETGPLERPYGRGVMLQLYVDELDAVLSNSKRLGVPIHSPLREIWRRHGDREGGQREFFLQDPDGYLIMVAQKIGERPLTG
jgi:catechol 2,3-dioxygenase-like lactoylglutathione lyase family enzyme